MRHSLRKQMNRVMLSLAMLFAGCTPPGFKEQHVAVSSEVFKSYSALFDVDRAGMGLPPLPTTGDVKIFTVDREHWMREYPPPNYDVSFQFYEGQTEYPRIARFVALKRTDDGYKWVSELVTFSGPARFVFDESEVNEWICITVETEQVTHIGANIKGTVIDYEGPDKRLTRARRRGDNLTPGQIGPILREWGYNYDADKTQPPGVLKPR